MNFKAYLKGVPKYIAIHIEKFICERDMRQHIAKWQKAGKPIPPHTYVKAAIIREYHKEYPYQTLVETGTCSGDMVAVQKHYFKKIFTIELSPKLFKYAQKRFKYEDNIMVLQGDSGKVLPEIMKQLDGPAIFWIDAHYSEGETAKGETECPILEELKAIFTNPKYDHVLLIDDARGFGQGDYPTIEEITKYVKSKNPAYQEEAKDDIIRYVVR